MRVGHKSVCKCLVLYLRRVLYLRAVALQMAHCTFLFEKFENSNILDHAHSILKHLYCYLWSCWSLNCFQRLSIIKCYILSEANEVKEIINDEGNKHFVYLVNKIDWVIMWHDSLIR